MNVRAQSQAMRPLVPHPVKTKRCGSPVRMVPSSFSWTTSQSACSSEVHGPNHPQGYVRHARRKRRRKSGRREDEG